MATLKAWQSRWRRHLSLPPNDLLRDAVYRRLWSSILISSFGGQVTMLALPLTAAVLLHATPTQMGLLTRDGDRAFRAVLAARRACGSTACASCRCTWSANRCWR